MRAKVRQTLVALGAAALTAGPMTVTGQYVDSPEALKNHAVAASPRAKEVFPWLRGTTPVVTREAGKSPLADVGSNRAILASPRMLENFPELRPMGRPQAASSAADELAAIRSNRALAASPRMLELFPVLARAPVETPCTCDVAALK